MPSRPYASARFHASGSTRIAVVIVMAAILSLVGQILSAGWMLYQGRQESLASARHNGAHLALLLDRDIANGIEMYDASLQAAVRAAQLIDRLPVPPELRADLLFNDTPMVPYLGAIGITDNRGLVIYRSWNAARPPQDLANRDYFRTQRDQPNAGLVLVPLAKPRGPTEFSLVLSRRIDHADGSFAGIAVGGMQSPFFESLLSNVRLGDHSDVALFTSDGTLIARFPMTNHDIGRRIGAGLETASPDGGVTIAEQDNPSDGITQLTVTRQVAKFPLYIRVDMALGDIYADWWRRAVQVGLVVLSVIASVAILLLLLSRELRRRSLAEASARANAAELKQLSETVDDVIVRVGWNLKSDYISPSVERLIGYRPAELLGGSMIERVHPDDRARVTDGLAAMQRRETDGFDATYRVRHRSGHWRHAEARGRVLADRSGAIMAIRDISDRISLEAQLREAQRMEAIGRLSAGVAHDFNNLLQAQMGSLELLQDAVTAGKMTDVDEFAAAALAMCERGASLTSHLLSFSRNQVLKPSVVMIGAFLGNLAQILGRTLGPSIHVSIGVDPRTGPAFVDPTLFETALLNLAFNGRDAMSRGGRLHIEVCPATVPAPPGAEGRQADDMAGATLAPGHYVVVAVSDEGVGMSPEVLAKAVEPFFSTKGANGSGLGLAMVHGFTRQSRGDLRIESSAGHGTRVEMWLPAAKQDKPPDDDAPPPARSGLAGHVLVVDDVADVLVTVAAFLEGAGFSVSEASSGEAAMALLQSGARFDALVTDFAMPKMDGANLIINARAIIPELPALVITGYAEQPMLKGLPRLRVLGKPFRREGLLQALFGVISTAAEPTPRPERRRQDKVDRRTATD